MVTQSHAVFNDKLINVVQSNLNLENNKILNLNLLQRRCLKISSVITKIYQINVLQILMFHHINNITILIHNQLFGKRFLLTDNDPLLLITERDITKHSTIVLDLSPPNNRNIAFHNSYNQKITRALLLLHNITQPIKAEILHAHLHSLWLIKL